MVLFGSLCWRRCLARTSSAGVPTDATKHRPFFQRGACAAHLLESAPLVLSTTRLHHRLGRQQHKFPLGPLGGHILAQQLQEQGEALAGKVPAEPQRRRSGRALRGPLEQGFAFQSGLRMNAVSPGDGPVGRDHQLLLQHYQAQLGEVRRTDRGECGTCVADVCPDHHRQPRRSENTESVVQEVHAGVDRLRMDAEAGLPERGEARGARDGDAQDDARRCAVRAQRQDDAVGIGELASRDLLCQLQHQANLADDAGLAQAACRNDPRPPRAIALPSSARDRRRTPEERPLLPGQGEGGEEVQGVVHLGRIRFGVQGL
mmetsp:Transcript_43018/g.125092  ORF Transcript_43018/g.125092 Transcript_43018/m.125092 type:complete len:317 (+) Transcript_43018:368-1318(+)